jgi:hypothetical protein
VTPRTLSDFPEASLLRCSFCGADLPTDAPVELFSPYGVAKCLQCGKMTPFRLEAA